MTDETLQEVPQEPVPTSLSDVIADLRGFGIEEFEEVLTLTMNSKTLRLKLANVPTEADLAALLAVDGLKNYEFFQEVKVEILSRAITEINGWKIPAVGDADRLVLDPTDGLKKDIQPVLRNLIKGWGIEVLQVLWRVLMVHSQTIEDRLAADFPQAAVLTNVERRYRDRVEREFEAYAAKAIQEQVDDLLDPEGETPAEGEFAQ